MTNDQKLAENDTPIQKRHVSGVIGLLTIFTSRDLSDLRYIRILRTSSKSSSLRQVSLFSCLSKIWQVPLFSFTVFVGVNPM